MPPVSRPHRYQPFGARKPRARRPSWIAFSALVALAPPAAAGPGNWSPDEIHAIRERPRIVRRNGGAKASFFVNAPAERAYRILTDHARLPEFMPNLDACRVLKQGPSWAEVEMRNAKGAMVLRRNFEPPTQIRWTLVAGPMLKRVEGSWRIDAVADGSILTYDSEVETRVPVPAFVLHFVQKDSLEALVSNVRQRIDSDGRWIKPDFKGSRP